MSIMERRVAITCGKWMVEIGKRQDVHIALTRIMRFHPPEEVTTLVV